MRATPSFTSHACCTNCYLRLLLLSAMLRYNHVVNDLRKPIILVLNKCDLVAPEVRSFETQVADDLAADRGNVEGLVP